MVRVRLLTGSERGQTVEAAFGVPSESAAEQRVRIGKTLVVARSPDEEGVAYYIVDRYRLPPMALIFGLFVALAVMLPA